MILQYKYIYFQEYIVVHYTNYLKNVFNFFILKLPNSDLL